VWRKYGIIIMLLSVILMFNSTKPDIIFDYNIKALGVKNMHQELEIYANNIPNFTKKYWANWFGQNDANLITYLPRIINTYSGYKLVINNMLEECIDSDIQINLGHHKCTGKKLTISQDLLKEVGVITILCNNISCNLAYNTNSRFKN
jgi:competence protein ComEC